MRFEDYKNANRGEQINVLAPGASLNFYDDEFWVSFFSKKVIGISKTLTAKKLFGVPDYWIGFDNISSMHKSLSEQVEELDRRLDHVVFFLPAAYAELGFIKNRVPVTNFSGRNGIVGYIENLGEANGVVSDMSLYGAISLACFMGSKRIDIVGADFGQYQGKYYWDDKIPWKMDDRNARKYSGQTAQFNLAVNAAEKKGIKINRVMPPDKQGESCSTR